MDQLAPGPGEAPAPRPKVAPLSPQRFLLQLTIGQSAHDKLRYAQALLGHQVPAGDVAEVLERALDALIEARRAAAHCETIPHAPLEQRLRVALGFFHPRGRAAKSQGTAAGLV